MKRKTEAFILLNALKINNLKTLNLILLKASNPPESIKKYVVRNDKERQALCNEVIERIKLETNGNKNLEIECLSLFMKLLRK